MAMLDNQMVTPLKNREASLFDPVTGGGSTIVSSGWLSISISKLTGSLFLLISIIHSSSSKYLFLDLALSWSFFNGKTHGLGVSNVSKHSYLIAGTLYL